MTEAAPGKRRPGRPRKDEELRPGIAKLDLVNGWLPAGTAEDDSNREVCRSLQQTWKRLTERQQRGVILFELTSDYEETAIKAGYAGKPSTAASKLKIDIGMPVVRQVFHLRTLLIGNTLPTVMSRRVLAQMIMGTHPIEVTANNLLRAIQINAQLAGELVPEIKPDELPADAVAGATRDENDRIMRATMGQVNIADDIKRRSKQAEAERKEALRVDTQNDEQDAEERSKATVTDLSGGLTPMERLIATQNRRA